MSFILDPGYGGIFFVPMHGGKIKKNTNYLSSNIVS
jgi:hypothetical protein